MNELLNLGGTALPLILKEPAASGTPLLDTTRSHVQRVMTEAAESRDV